MGPCPRQGWDSPCAPGEHSGSRVIAESVKEEAGVLQLWFESTQQLLALLGSVIISAFCKTCRRGPTGETPRL